MSFSNKQNDDPSISCNNQLFEISTKAPLNTISNEEESTDSTVRQMKRAKLNFFVATLLLIGLVVGVTTSLMKSSQSIGNQVFIGADEAAVSVTFDDLTTLPTTNPSISTMDYNKERLPQVLKNYDSISPTNSPTMYVTKYPTSLTDNISTHEINPYIGEEKSYTLMQVGNSIFGTSTNSLFGYSMSISNMAKKLSIGTPFYNGPFGTNSGMVQVYEKEKKTTTWSQIAPHKNGDNPNDWMGWSVKISSDGEWVAINGGLTSRRPYIKIFQNSIGNMMWIQKGSTIVGKERIFGISISMNKNGSRLAVGSRTSARVYHYDDKLNDWVPIGDQQGIMEHSDSYVALSGDGNILAVGCPKADDSKFSKNAGRVRFFKVDITSNILRQIGDSIYGNHYGDNFGYSISMSYDGSIVAIGTFAANYVKVFRLVIKRTASSAAPSWEQIGDDIVGNSQDKKFGFSLSLSENGKRVIVGSYLFKNHQGRAIIFQHSNQQQHGRWDQIGDDIQGEAKNDHEGFEVCISADGNYVAVSAIYGDRDDNGVDISNNKGRVRIFEII